MNANPILKQGLKLFAPGGRLGKLQILLYHRVLKEPDPLRPWEIDRYQFDEQMQALSNYYQILPLSEAMQLLQKKALPPQAVCITFDDGYEDNVSVALPILQKLNIPATFFIATGFLDGDIMWNDQVIESIRQHQDEALNLTERGLSIYATKSIQDKNQSIQLIINAIKHKSSIERTQIVQSIAKITDARFEALMMNQNGVRTLAEAGMEIGAHTVTHPILKSLSLKEAEAEILNSKETLESILGQSIRYFAYPNGYPSRDYGLEHCRMLKRIGFKNGFSTWWGAADADMDPFQMPRFTPWDRSTLRFMLRLTQYRYNIKGQPVV